MDIAWNKLQCSRPMLQGLLEAVKAIHSKAIGIEAKSGFLTFQTSNQGRKYTELGCIDHVLVRIPYGGGPDMCFAAPKPLLQAVYDAQGGALEIPTRACPLGWEDYPAPSRGREGTHYDGGALQQALAFLLRLNPFGAQRADCAGIFCDGESFSVTDGVSIHVQHGMVPLTTDGQLLGGDAAACLVRMLGILPPHGLQVSRSPKAGYLVFYLLNELGIEVLISSTYRTPPNTKVFSGVPITPDSIGIVVHSEFLLSVLDAAIASAKNYPVVRLRTTDTGLEYQAMDMQESKFKVLYQGELPMTRSFSNPGHVEMVLAADRLKSAIFGQGETTQIIVPCDARTGFEFYSVQPVYVNCNPAQFSLIMPIATDKVWADTLLQKRREHLSQELR